MLSDEEKKAINQLKADTNFYDYELKNGKYIYELFKIEVYKKDVDVILNLIEKQSKEIEELKNSDLTTVYLNGVYDGEKKVEDKIKAKIEPKLKELDEQMKKEWKEYGNSREYQDMEDEWNFLQSLLEKE